jgi:hypothetical protein
MATTLPNYRQRGLFWGLLACRFGRGARYEHELHELHELHQGLFSQSETDMIDRVFIAGGASKEGKAVFHTHRSILSGTG